MAKRLYVDFAFVPPEQAQAHERLLLWAKYMKRQPGPWGTHPMWRDTPSGFRQWHVPVLGVPECVADVGEVEKRVRELPLALRQALRWYYINGRNPVLFARRFGVSADRLREMVIEARARVGRMLGLGDILPASIDIPPVL